LYMFEMFEMFEMFDLFDMSAKSIIVGIATLS